MSRPWKHPRTGVFWLRKRVPENLQPVVGKQEELRTLGTKDADEAKRRFPQALAEVEARWASLRLGVRDLTEREAHRLAATIHDNWLALHANNPSDQLIWQPEFYNNLWVAGAPLPGNDEPFLGSVGIDELCRQAMRRLCFQQADLGIAIHGLITDDTGRFRLAKAIAAAFQRASLTLLAVERGELDPATIEHKPMPMSANQVTGRPAPAPLGQPLLQTVDAPITLDGMLERWWAEARAAGRKPSTYASYRHTFGKLASFLGHNDATKVTTKDVIAFKDHRLSTPSSRTGKVPTAKTVKDSDLSALKTVFGWGVINALILVNPAIGVTIKLGKPTRIRSKGFSDAEAKAILSAALNFKRGNESALTASAKKWVPWLCALTGARVGEIAQLRKQDVTLRDGLWVIRITPEAGTVKTNEAREVVLHPQLVALGFPAFVAASIDGPLFLQPGKHGDVLGPLRGLKNRLAAFARSIVKDPGVAPNHGWRHRFKTVGMEAGIAPRILDSIQGQAARSVADNYGDVTIKTISKAIALLPFI